MRFVAGLLVVFVCSCTFASEPGQPLDCSDWVIHIPGISCVTVRPYPCAGQYLCTVWGADTDNAGNGVVFSYESSGAICGSRQLKMHQLLLIAPDGSETLVASLVERCSGSGADSIHGDVGETPRVAFDSLRGRAMVKYWNGSDGGAYPSGAQTMAFEGFATLFDVLQTYSPQASLGFRVPYMPEGMAGADHFDTYWGNLTHPLDFTQAHPLACDYPAAAPHVGDYLTVIDPLPNPEPATGRYYITRATYQGTTRYGRKTTAGHLTGRDPAVLPACTP